MPPNEPPPELRDRFVWFTRICAKCLGRVSWERMWVWKRIAAYYVSGEGWNTWRVCRRCAPTEADAVKIKRAWDTPGHSYDATGFVRLEPWLEDDFSTYSSTANMLTDPLGLYGADENSARMVLDQSVGVPTLGLTQSLRYDWPTMTNSFKRSFWDRLLNQNDMFPLQFVVPPGVYIPGHGVQEHGGPIDLKSGETITLTDDRGRTLLSLECR